MPTRWLILLVLFFARFAMAAQFESIGSLAPLLHETDGLTLSDIGLLIGLYLVPGAALALPGGAIARALGDKRTMLLSLVMMIGGGLLATRFDWQAQFLARLLCGAGGVVLTVAASKAIVDLFSGRELATALGMFVNSWPAGIAVALVSLPALGERYGLYAASLMNVVLPALAFLAIALFVPGRNQGRRAQQSHGWPSGPAIAALIAAGAIWGIMNAAFATLFGFGPILLAERGLPASSASSMVSTVLWMTIIAIPLGGILADRVPRSQTIILAGIGVGTILTFFATRTDQTLLTFAALGLVAGMPAAAVMSLPSRVLTEDTRAAGMGFFYTAYYLLMMLLPPLQGFAAKFYDSTSITFDIAGIALLLAAPMLLVFDKLAAQQRLLAAV
jgi:MFS family permease